MPAHGDSVVNRPARVVREDQIQIALPFRACLQPFAVLKGAVAVERLSCRLREWERANTLRGLGLFELPRSVGVHGQAATDDDAIFAYVFPAKRFRLSRSNAGSNQHFPESSVAVCAGRIEKANYLRSREY